MVVAFLSEEVTVTGSPQLELDFDGTAKTADYVSNLGSEVPDPTELKFTYTVAPNDIDTDGIAIGDNKLTLSGGTIQDSSENDADLTLKSIPSQSGHMVDASDNTPPTVSSIAITSDPGDDDTYGLGDAIEVTVTFNEDVTVTGTPQLELDFDGTAKIADYSRTGGVVRFKQDDPVEHRHLRFYRGIQLHGGAGRERHRRHRHRRRQADLNGGTIKDAAGQRRHADPRRVASRLRAQGGRGRTPWRRPSRPSP